jgi:hypothetical protein
MVRSIKLLVLVVLALVLFRLEPAAAQAMKKKPPSGPAITGVELSQSIKMLEPKCPAVLIFDGHITTTRPTVVTYKFVDSHGHVWPEHHKRFSLAGRNGVSHKWKLGRPGKTVDAWVELQVLSPDAKSSGKVPVRFTCSK